MRDWFDCLEPFSPPSGRAGRIVSLPRLAANGWPGIPRLPVCLRIVLESVARNTDGLRIDKEHVAALATWEPRAPRTADVPFMVGRVLLQDFTGVPLLVDLAAMRAAAARAGHDPAVIEPNVPVDLVIDHSVQVDFARSLDALARNMEFELRRNRPRYEFLKWGTSTFHGLRVVPPGIGIVHQVNLELLARGVVYRDGMWFPDTLVGTDSHTPMVNGLGVLGWGVGGIEAEAAMLGQPVSMLMPDVVGVHCRGALRPGVTGTDLVLHVTEILRARRVVGKLVEFHGEGAASLPVPERATVANMAPEYGATCGYFPVDEATLRYYRATGRDAAQVEAVRRYHVAQGIFGMPEPGDCDYSEVVALDLADVRPSAAGPKRPQDRVDLADVPRSFREAFVRKDGLGYGRSALDLGQRFAGLDGPPLSDMGGGGDQQDNGSLDGRRDTNPLTEVEMMGNRPTPDRVPARPPEVSAERCPEIGHGDILIAALTSCTNTSNPAVMLAAGLLARNAVRRGLRVGAQVKTSLAPGSRVVTRYLERTGLQRDLDALGFRLVGYGCTTCIGNSGPLDPRIDALVAENDVVAVAVLSGNRNFEARIHQTLRAAYLMSPPLVVAYALAGRIGVDLTSEPLGTDVGGRPVYLRDLWPSPKDLDDAMAAASFPSDYRELYQPESLRTEWWDRIPVRGGLLYPWDEKSAYIREPPYFEGFGMRPEPPGDVLGARVLALFGDSVTTDHISPAGAIPAASPAGQWLMAQGVTPEHFNSYGARRGNHHVMVRGTFANVRIRNLLVPGVEGGVTVHQPSGTRMSIFDAAAAYAESGTPLVIIAGSDYGAGSSRDWAAKGPRLLGVRAVIAKSFERIHRQNLVGMGVLPCRVADGRALDGLHLDGSETFDVLGVAGGVEPRQAATLVVHRASGERVEVAVEAGIETPVEADYYRHGGILPYVLRTLVTAAALPSARGF